MTLDLTAVEPEVAAALSISLPSMPVDGEGQTFVVLEREEGTLPVGRIGCTLSYRMREIDPATGEAEEEGYQDEYQVSRCSWPRGRCSWPRGCPTGIHDGALASCLLPLNPRVPPPFLVTQVEDVELSHRDYIKAVNVGNWRHAWDQLPGSTERSDDYGLGPRERLEDAVEATLKALGEGDRDDPPACRIPCMLMRVSLPASGMSTCEGTDIIQPNARSHTVLLSGSVLGQRPIMARVQFGAFLELLGVELLSSTPPEHVIGFRSGMDGARNVAMKVISRGESDEIAELVHLIIQSA